MGRKHKGEEALQNMESIANIRNYSGCSVRGMAHEKIVPEDKIYPIWTLFIMILFALVVIFVG